MSQLSKNLSARREFLQMSIMDVAVALNNKGVDVSYPTVASWFNGQRGERWRVNELRALLDVLQTDLETMAGDAELTEDPIGVAAAREFKALTPEQQQAVMMMIRSMRP